MRLLFESVEHFFFAARANRPLRICRAAFGASLFLHYVSLIGHVQELFGAVGLTGSRFFEHVTWAVPVARGSVRDLRILQAFDSEAVIYSLYALLLVSSLCFAVGYKWRFSGWTALLLHTLFHAQDEFAFWGWGSLIRPLMAYVLLGGGEESGPAWPQRLLQIHVTTIYIVAAWSRIVDPNWLNGSELYGILTDSVFARFDSDLITLKPVLRLLCYAAWGLELSTPLTLWWRRTRRPTVYLLATMHLGLEGLTMVGYWNILLLAALSTFTNFDRRRDSNWKRR